MRPSKADQRVQDVLDRGVEYLDEILDMLLDEAKGVHFVVSPRAQGGAGRKAKLVTQADEVEKTCKTCKQPILKEPRVEWEVWKERRDGPMLKFLYEQMVGRAKQRESQKIDPEIVVVFGDIDSVEGVEAREQGSRNEVKEIKGSHPRTGDDIGIGL